MALLSKSSATSTSPRCLNQESTKPSQLRPAHYGLWIIVLGCLHTLQTLLFGAVHGLDLHLILRHTDFAHETLFAILLGYSLYGLPLILLGVCLHALEQNPISKTPACLLIIALGLALISILALIVQPYTVFWLGLIIAIKILLCVAQNKSPQRD